MSDTNHTDPTPAKVAVLGLGKMGSGIAHNIERAGISLTVWNRSAEKTRSFEDTKAAIAGSLEEAVGGADVVVTSLMDDKSVLDLVEHDGRLLKAMKPGAIHLCATTLSPKAILELDRLHRDAGTRFVAGPVLGRPDAAEAGDLTTLLGGEEDAVSRVAPICQAYCSQVIPVPGGPQSAAALKLGLNFMAVSSIEALSEAYAMVEVNGGDTRILSEMFAHQFFSHPALKMYARKIQQRDFETAAGFTMSGGLKDVRLMIETAESGGVELDIARLIEGKIIEAIDAGWADKDWSAFSEITRRRAGME